RFGHGRPVADRALYGLPFLRTVPLPRFPQARGPAAAGRPGLSGRGMANLVWSAAARRRFGSGEAASIQSGVEPPHSKPDAPSFARTVRRRLMYWIFTAARRLKKLG